MIGAVCHLDKMQHVVVHHAVLDWIKRCVPSKIGDHLFLYFHTIERTFVLAEWVSQGVFRDLRNFGPTLRVTRENTESLRRLLNPHSTPGESYADQLREGEYDQNRQRQDCNDYLVDRNKYMNKTSESVLIGA